MKIFVVFFFAFAFAKILAYPKYYAEEAFKWKNIEYEALLQPENSYVGPYPYYIPENNAIGGMAYHPASGLMIVDIVRLRPGVPLTLGAFCTRDYKKGSSPKIWGFPDYELNALEATDFANEKINKRSWDQGGFNQSQDFRTHQNYVHKIPIYGEPPNVAIEPLFEIKRIIAVFHTTIDEKCNRVFFVDNGEFQYYQNTTYTVQKPSLWVLGIPEDACTSRNFSVIRRLEVSDRIAAKGSGFTQIYLDYTSDYCDDLFLYITNPFVGYLMVYDYRKSEFYYFDHETFLPILSESYLVFNEKFHFQMNLGIFAISLGYPDKYGQKIAYYTDIASTAQYEVSTAILRDRRKSPENYRKDDFRIMGYRGDHHQCFKTLIDYETGVMFYSEAQSNQIRCWNIKRPLNPDNIDVVFESEKFDFGLQMFLDSQGYLWFLYNVVPIIWASDKPLDLNQVNTRFFRMKASEVIRGTVCENI
ncbi:L-dopachrome tautomerase yellow-f2-like [Lutzomyia longipalpis]|uniref:L-dopachrome tautomerase yellow-f2-like n=1 Tax=Lutzomyia longipalpis TaxID=7200 RepID=UPI002483A868|nr:L-dopachrome tautomerase yellow-f2-like [Lutzomyia longipalpis]